MRNNYSTLNNVWVFKTKPQHNSIETCKNDLLTVLKQVNSDGRDSDYTVGSCTFPRYSANLQDYGACPLPITSCGPNMLTGVTYENKQCKAPISWYDDAIAQPRYSNTTWKPGNINSISCNPSTLGTP